MSTALSQAEHDEIRQVFELFDVEQTGKISAEELEHVMESLHLDDTNNDAIQSFRRALSEYCNQQNDELLDLDAFESLVLSKRTNNTSTNNNNEWKDVFDLFDKTNKGYITMDDLKAVAENLGEKLTNTELEEMIDRAKPNVDVNNTKHDGRISFDEFEAIMTKNLFSSTTTTTS